MSSGTPPEATFRPEDRDPSPPDESPTEQARDEDREEPAVKPDPSKFLPDLDHHHTGPAPQTDREVDDHVVATIRAFERDAGDYINLANLRAALHPDLDRDQVDAAFQRLNNHPAVHFVPDDDQETMTREERDAALRIGGEPNHLVVIDPRATTPPDQQDTATPAQDTPAPTEQGGGLESNVRGAYDELATKKQDWVRLSDLRDKLGNPPAAEMDRILLDMIRTGRVHLAPDSDRKALTDADHAAAVRIGDQDKHLIAIEPPDDDPYWR